MNFTYQVFMKHMGHRAKDLLCDCEIDLDNKKIKVRVEWIDSVLIETQMTNVLVNRIDQEMDKVGKPRYTEEPYDFAVKLVVANQFVFDLDYVPCEWMPQASTLVMWPHAGRAES